MTLGIGAATLAGAGAAFADDAGSETSSASSSASSSAGSGSAHDGEARSLSSRRDAAKARRLERRAARAEARAGAAETTETEEVKGSEVAEVEVEEVEFAEVEDIGKVATGDDATDPVEVAAAALPLSAAVRREAEATDVAATAATVTSAAAAADPRVEAVVKLGSYFPESVAASPDGRYVYAGTGTVTLASGSVAVIDARTNTVKKTISTDFVVTGLAVAPNGTVYAAGIDIINEQLAVAVVGVISKSHRLTKTITLGQGTSHYMPLTVTPDGKSVVVGWGTVSSTAGYVGAVSTINTSNNRVARTVTFTGDVADLAVAPDSNTAVVAVNRYPTSLLKVDLGTGAVTAIDINAVATDALSVALTPGGVFAFVAYDGGNDDIAIVHLFSGDVVDTFAAGTASDAEKIRLSADGRTLYAIAGSVMHTIDVSSRATLDTLIVGPGVHYWSSDIALGPDGKVYLSTHYDNSIAVVSTTTANDNPVVSVLVGDPRSSTGKVKGSIVASDPNGGALTYSATAPTNGKATLRPSGAFTYTPTAQARHAAAASSAASTDSFTVTVRNASGGSTTVTVTVPIAPKNSAPAVRASVGRPDEKTGAVVGKITGRDADGDEFGFSVSVNPRRGTVVVAADGSFTYSPTQNSRLAAGAAQATRGVKQDDFVIAASDGHGAASPVSIKVRVAPIKLKTTAQELFSTMDPGTHDKLTAQLVSGSRNQTRMVVYMTGVDGDAWSGAINGSLADGIHGAAGWLNPKVSAFIDSAVEAWQPSEIMLVGFSAGGMQMQNYAAAGTYGDRIQTMVLFGAPLTKTLDEIGVKQGSSKSVLLIADLGDQVWTRWTRGYPCDITGCADHTDAENSYNADNTDKGTIYWAGKATNTHNQATYRDDAAEFDKFISRRAASYFKKPYKDWQSFAGTVIGVRTTRTVSP